MVFNCLLGETARIKIRLTETKHFKIMDTFGFDHLSLRKNKKHTAARAIIGQRGTLPVTPLGYVNPKKVIFRTMRTMRKQFPVNWLTSGRFSGPKRGGVNK